MLIREERSQMPEPHETVAINVDGKALSVEKELSILQAAQQNDIYIPTTLCPPKISHRLADADYVPSK